MLSGIPRVRVVYFWDMTIEHPYWFMATMALQCIGWILLGRITERRTWQRRLVDGTFYCVAREHRWTRDRICRKCGLLQPPTVQLAD
jgi:hypothetical protein